MDAEGETDADGLIDVDRDGLIEDDGDREGEAEADAETDGEIEADVDAEAETFPNPAAWQDRYRLTVPEASTRWAVCDPVMAANVRSVVQSPGFPVSLCRMTTTRPFAPEKLSVTWR